MKARMAEGGMARRHVPTAIIFVTICAIGLPLGLFFRDHLISEEMVQAKVHLEDIGKILSSVVNRRQALLGGLEAYVSAKDYSTEAMSDFAQYAAAIRNEDRSIRAIQIFPPDGKAFVHPIEGNEAIANRGFVELLSDERPEVQQDLRRTIRSRGVTLSEPYSLRQGGMGIVARKAVYRAGSLWGMVVVVLDLEPLLSYAGIGPDYYSAGLSIRGESGQLFHGQEVPSFSDSVSCTVILPEGAWTMVSSLPPEALQRVKTSLSLYWLLVLATCILSVLSLNIFLSRLRSLRKQVEAGTSMLDERSERYKAIFEQSAEGIFVADHEGRILEVNPRASVMLGRDKGDVLDRQCGAFFDGWEEVPFQLAKVAAGGAPNATLNQRISRAGGEALYVEVLWRRNNDGSYLGIARETRGQVELPGIEGKSEGAMNRLLELDRRSRLALLSKAEDQRILETELRNSQHRFQQLFEIAPVPLQFISNEGRLKEANERWERTFGYTREDIPTIEAWWKHTCPDPDYRCQAIEVWEEAMREARERRVGPIGPIDFSLTCKNGEVLAMEVTGTFLEDDLLMAFFDITERKRAEEELRKVYENLAIAQKIAHLGSHEHDIATDRLYWSDEVFEIFGISRRDFKESSEDFFSRIHPEDRSMVTACIAQAYQTRTDAKFEHRIILPDGSIRIVEEQFKMRFNDHGEHMSNVGTIQDITERKKVERSLQIHSERLNNLHLIDQAIIKGIDSPETIAQGAIERVCDLLNCRRIGVSLLEVEGGKVRVIAAFGETAAMSSAAVETAEEGQALSVMEVPILSSQGRLGVLRIDWDEPRVISQEEREIAGEVASQISIAIEQSRLREETRRHAEELEGMIRVRTSQLESANKEMEAFTYSVSHDLRAPLRAIAGFSRFIEEDYAESLDSEGKRLLGVIRHNTVKMDKLITDLLNLSRITRSELRKSSIDMERLVKEACSELEPNADGNPVSIEVGRLPPAEGDASLLRQVWLNLVGNAIKYSMKSPSRRIEIGCLLEDGHQVYFIKDEGAGFEPEYAGRLFNPFHRLHKSEDFEGTGIGLAIVQRVIERHGGRVRAESPGQGKGATFYFSIPVKESAGG